MAILYRIMQLLLSNLAIILTDAIFTPHAHRERGKVIGLGVLIKTILNCTLVIDLPFQTFAVGPLVEFIVASMSEPHTSELNGIFFVCVCVCVCVCLSVSYIPVLVLINLFIRTVLT